MTPAPSTSRRDDARPGLDFSFSGLKTALVYRARELGTDGVVARRADLAASFQAAVVGQLFTAKLERALEAGDWPVGPLGGGRRERPPGERAREICDERGNPAEACRARAPHRQRGDDRLGGALTGDRAVPRLPRPGRAGLIPMAVVTLYTRDGAISADEAREEILALRGDGPGPRVARGFIESDDDLHARLLERIPVVEAGEAASRESDWSACAAADRGHG